jgi:DnaJ like chaperone protein
MHIWGKVFGFIFGFMLSKSLLGAFIGLWIGHSFDKGRRIDFDGFSPEKTDDITRQAVFFYTSFSVMGHIAKANGQVSQQEIAFANDYMDRLGLNSGMKKQAQDAFQEGKSSTFPIDERLRKFKRACGKRHDLLLMFLEIQIQVAFADGLLDEEEYKVLHKIARYLGFSRKELDNLLDMITASAAFNQQGSHYSNNKRQQSGRQHTNRSSTTSGQQLDNAYKILGISKMSELREIKKSYKKLMLQHHPDKLVAKGLPPEMMEIAKQKTQDIQAAYDLISKQL